MLPPWLLPALASDTLTHITGNYTLSSSCLGRARWLHGCRPRVLHLGGQTENHPSQRASGSLIETEPVWLALCSAISSEPAPCSRGPLLAASRPRERVIGLEMRQPAASHSFPRAPQSSCPGVCTLATGELALGKGRN